MLVEETREDERELLMCERVDVWANVSFAQSLLRLPVDALLQRIFNQCYDQFHLSKNATLDFASLASDHFSSVDKVRSELSRFREYWHVFDLNLTREC